jgi:hypothetical protein
MARLPDQILTAIFSLQRQLVEGINGSASICCGLDTVIETNHLYRSSNGMPPLWTPKGA